MTNGKIVVVIGATGAQGGGLARALLTDTRDEFAVRAVTRDVNSDKARLLATQGAEVVAADLDDVESLKRAFAGAYGAFCMTNFWEHNSPEKELSQAANLAQAASVARVEHVIWSTLEDTRKWIPLSDDRMPTLLEKYKVPHLDAKGEANQFFEEQDVPTTLLHTSFYWDNLIYFGLGPKRNPEGRLEFTLPMGGKKLPGIAAEDIGKCAQGIFKAGYKYIGQSVGIAGEHLTGMEMADALSKALSEEVVYNAVSPETFRSFGFPGADDLGNMFQFKRDFEADYCGARDIEFSRSLNAELLTFYQWLENYKSLIPLE